MNPFQHVTHLSAQDGNRIDLDRLADIAAYLGRHPLNAASTLEIGRTGPYGRAHTKAGPVFQFVPDHMDCAFYTFDATIALVLGGVTAGSPVKARVAHIGSDFAHRPAFLITHIEIGPIAKSAQPPHNARAAA